MSKVSRIKWSTKDCGGILVHGTASCSSDKCYCSRKPMINYPLFYSLLQTVYTVKDKNGALIKPYLYVKSEHGITEKWEKVLDPLKQHPLFNIEDLDIKAASLKKQFEDAIEDFETANSLNDKAAGFEFHPERTPYFDLMYDIWKERKLYSEKAAAEKSKDKQIHNTCLFFESNVIGNESGDNALRAMETLDDAEKFNFNDEFEDQEILGGEEVITNIKTPSYSFKKRKKKESPANDSVSSVMTSDTKESSEDTDIQLFKRMCRSVTELDEEKQQRLQNETKLADAQLLQAQNIQKLLEQRNVPITSTSGDSNAKVFELLSQMSATLSNLSSRMDQFETRK